MVITMKAITNKPPRGYNSFDSYGWSVTEDEFKKNVEFFDKNLKQFGYNIMTVDFCWSHPGGNTEPNPNQDEALETMLTMDKFGRLFPSPDRFPTSHFGCGFKPLSDYVHGKGMKFGIHLMRGIPKQAVEMNTPIKGTNFTARDAADTDALHCWWLNHMHPLNMAHPAAQAYLDSIFELYDSWGVDFVKVDDLSSPYSDMEVEGYAKAIAKAEREIILSLSPGATPTEKSEHVSQYANMWRISPDFWDNFEPLKKNFMLFDAWSKLRVENTYPDGDMIPFGKLSLRGPMGEPRYSSFTYDEKISLMSMWAINGSPLILGGEMNDIDDKTLGLLTNSDILHMNDCAHSAHKISENDDLLTWTAVDKFNKKLTYIAIFNLSDNEYKSVNINLADYNAELAKDLWTGKEYQTSGSVKSLIRPHGAVVFALI